ncbi:MAG: helix-turn-helix domain-containing protein [Opitutaceae bacterium]|jgi:predicted site-specific integrase-resolvase
MDVKTLLTVRQVAEMFDRTEQTIALWYRAGKIPCIRIPGAKKDAIRFDFDAVVAWAKENHKRLSL